MASNPLCQFDDRGRPVLELKMGLLVWLDGPPSPRMARAVYDLYMQRFGSHIRIYCATTPGSLPSQWTAGVRHSFENRDLPKLRRLNQWGYGFSDGFATNSWLFMFHGYRPQSEKGRASFYRFDFPWDTDPTIILELATELAGVTPFRSGIAGPYFQMNPETLAASLDAMYARAWQRPPRPGRHRGP